jgi:hypothetical protein
MTPSSTLQPTLESQPCSGPQGARQQHKQGSVVNVNVAGGLGAKRHVQRRTCCDRTPPCTRRATYQERGGNADAVDYVVHAV